MNILWVQRPWLIQVISPPFTLTIDTGQWPFGECCWLQNMVLRQCKGSYISNAFSKSKVLHGIFWVIIVISWALVVRSSCVGISACPMGKKGSLVLSRGLMQETHSFPVAWYMSGHPWGNSSSPWGRPVSGWFWEEKGVEWCRIHTSGRLCLYCSYC